MKLLLTSDWHMAGPRDPACRIQRSNDDILRVLDRWQHEYQLIVLNGDIFESLKGSQIRFDHTGRTQELVERRRPLVDRFLHAPYLWTVGNHDFPLEWVLRLPVSVQVQLDHGMHLFAEHGHLTRAPREFYTDYHTIYHLMYCAGWWSSWIRRQLGIPGDAGDSIEALLHWYWRTTSSATGNWPTHLMGAVLARLSTPADRNLPAFMARSAETLYQRDNGLITMGHSHYFHEVRFSGGRTYINTGRGYRRGRICGVEFDTDSRSVTQVLF